MYIIIITPRLDSLGVYIIDITSISNIEDVSSKFTLSIDNNTVNVPEFAVYKYAKFLYFSWWISLKKAISAGSPIPFTLSNSLGISKLYCQNGALYVNGIACGSIVIDETGAGWYMNTGDFTWSTSITNIQVRMFALYT